MSDDPTYRCRSIKLNDNDRLAELIERERDWSLHHSSLRRRDKRGRKQILVHRLERGAKRVERASG